MLKLIPPHLLKLCRDISRMGGTPYLVGGCVRDYLLGLQPKDFDVEVFNMDAHNLEGILNNYGSVNLVGRSFGVYKLEVAGHDFDFSLPRRDNKAGVGHKDFDVTVDPTMTVEEAASRRDYTINAIMYDVMEDKIVDPFHGQAHLNWRVLIPTSHTHFGEDPLRPLRGMQFAARFNMWASAGTIVACKNIKEQYPHLPKERIWGEWYKWATQSKIPSVGLNFLHICDWLSLYPELHALVGLPQDPIWHPETSVDIHTNYVCDAANEIANFIGLEGEDRAVLLFSALCHDLGKATTTSFCGDPPRWRSPGHAEAGVPIAGSFLKSIGCLPRIIERVLPLVQEHMFHVTKEFTPRTIRRLLHRLGPHGDFQMLTWLMEADHSGRPPLPGGMPESVYTMIKIRNELPTKIEPILMGRHLLTRGYSPGPELGPILKAAMQAQLDGEFNDLNGALEWLDKQTSRPS